MSFDIYIGSACGTFEEDVGNYTSNMGGYFRWALSEDGEPTAEDRTRCDSRDALFGERMKDGLPALDGMAASDAKPILLRAVERTAEAKPDFLASFNASNGWGSWPTALEYLKRILVACDQHPEGALRVSY